MVNNVERHTSGRSQDEAAVIKERAGESLQAERKIQQDVLLFQSTAFIGWQESHRQKRESPGIRGFRLVTWCGRRDSNSHTLRR